MRGYKVFVRFPSWVEAAHQQTNGIIVVHLCVKHVQVDRWAYKDMWGLNECSCNKLAELTMFEIGRSAAAARMPSLALDNEVIAD